YLNRRPQKKQLSKPRQLKVLRKQVQHLRKKAASKRWLMRIDVLTLFPGMFPGYLNQSLLNKAIERGLVEVVVHDIRNWSRDKHQKVDDRPYGGGPGMVMRVEPVVESVEDVQRMAPTGQLILLSPQGR